ncbi:unnamed protein product [Thelazia callipaeda]|uniref:Syntaxin-6_N domain-containing protein n=1 Tax=Thelazia callipaeda TaxID=103827 RepID=A0A0N5CK68_THECL|nr:unnamed protein product [Thelazia callipaeda]
MVNCHHSDSSLSATKTTLLRNDVVSNSDLSKSRSPSYCHKSFFGDFRSWDEVFSHLKRELVDIRQRDAQIFADLQLVELQLENVKHQALTELKPDSNINTLTEGSDRFRKRRVVKLGELVESMTL